MLGIFLLTIVFAANIMLALAVVANNPKARLNQSLAAMAILLAFWSIVVYLEDAISGHNIIDVLVRLDYGLVVLITGLFYIFCVELTEIRLKWLSVTVWILIIANLFLTSLGYTNNVIFSSNGAVFVPGIGIYEFLALILIASISGFYILTQRYLTSKGIRRSQIAYIGTGILITITLLIATDLVAPRVFGINDANVTRLGIYGILAFTSLSSYTIIRFKFLNIRTLVARSLSFIFLLIALAGIYSAFIFAISQYVTTTTQGPIAHDAINTILAVVLAFTFQPLRRFFEHITDSFFYRDRYDPQVVLNDFSKILVSEIDLERLLRQSLTVLCGEMRIEYAQLAIFDNDRIYRIEHHGKIPERLMVGPEMRQLKHTLLIADELDPGNIKEIMDEHGISVSLMLRTHEQFVGYLLLGDKLSGEIYSKQDIELLEIAGKQLAVATSNAKAYAEIQEFNLTLQARVDHATNRIRIANRHLKELDKAKDEFISMASHQLRTPLTTIKGYLSMMLDGDAGKITTTQREFVSFAFGASERMVNLISDLLNVSRLSAGRFIIQSKPTDMVVMVQDEIRQLMSHAAAKNIGLVFTPPSTPIPMAEIDENKTRQVVMNFIDNAIYYTKEGAVTLSLSQVGESVRLEVKDTGIGVPDKAKRKLFSKFFRAENAQSVRPDGTGLGLYLARRVINDQGGTIIFDSVEGKGSTFGFELPLKAVTQPTTKG
jgi:signal transduction histidine kinase